jgi:hypothetical protein
MTTDWGAIGTAAALIYIAFMQERNAKRQKKTAKAVQEIHVLTDGAMTTQKRLLAEVTASKAAITKSEADIKAADDALKDYLLSLQTQATVKAQEKIT